MPDKPTPNKTAPTTLVGRTLEFDLLVRSLSSGRHTVIEGPVGVGKTTLATEVAKQLHRPVIRVDGDQRFSEQKLIGSFDPSLVVKTGFGTESFNPGPLTEALQKGAVLLLNELNRMPESAQNVLLPALDERKILIPHLGWIEATPGFVVIATQNPREYVATTQISEALLDRFNWIFLDYASSDEETEIVYQNLLRHTSTARYPQALLWSQIAVQLVRITRHHLKIKRGASVRAALSLAELLCTSTEVLAQKNPAASKTLDLGTIDWQLFETFAQMVLATRMELLQASSSGTKFQSQLHGVIHELVSQLQEALKKKS